MRSLRVDEEIELRRYAESDAGELLAAVTENFEHLRPFLHWVTPEYSLETARQFIAQSQKAFDERTRLGYGIFFNRKLIGSAGFVNFSWDSRRAEIGYWIAKGFEGKGIMTRSCRVLITYAFTELNLNRIEIRCATENYRSRAIPERLGFKLEGVLRQAQWRHTRLYDIAFYGLLKKDWDEGNNK